MGMFSRSYRNHTGSIAESNRNQGGGDKKAGFPYMIGRMASGLGHVDPQPLTRWNTTIMPMAHITRPISSLSNANRSYWNIQ